MKIFGREPTLWIAVINSVVMMGATLGLRWLDNEQAGLIVAGINAVFAAANAWAVRPISVPVFTYAATSLLSVGAAYGFSVTPEQLAGINSTLVVVLSLITRGQVSPQETAISSSSLAATKAEVQTVPEG